MAMMAHLFYRHWSLPILLTGLLIVCSVRILSAGANDTKFTITPTGIERSLIRVQKGLASVKVKEARLEDVLGEIESQTGISLVLHGSRPERISAEFESVRLDEALRRLITDNFLLVYSPVVEQLHKGNQEERWNAVLALGESKDDRALELVVWALKEDEDPSVREGAIWALESVGGPRAFNALADVDIQRKRCFFSKPRFRN